MKKYLIFVLVLAMLCLSGCDLPMLGSSDGALKRPGLDLGGFFGGEPDYSQEEAVGTAPVEMPAEEAVATEPVEMPMEEVIKEIMDGTIDDGKTIAAVLKASQYLKANK